MVAVRLSDIATTALAVACRNSTAQPLELQSNNSIQQDANTRALEQTLVEVQHLWIQEQFKAKERTQEKEKEDTKAKEETGTTEDATTGERKQTSKDRGPLDNAQNNCKPLESK